MKKTANKTWRIEWQQRGEIPNNGRWVIVNMDKETVKQFDRPNPVQWAPRLTGPKPIPYFHFLSRFGSDTQYWDNFEDAMQDQLQMAWDMYWGHRDPEEFDVAVVEGDQFVVQHPDGPSYRFVVGGEGIEKVSSFWTPLSKFAKGRKYEKNYVEKKKTPSGGVVRIYDEKHVKNRWKKKEKRLKNLEKNITKLRKKYHADLKSDDPKTRAIAAVVGLMDDTAMRIGNEDSVDEFETFGATTLQKRHVSTGGKLRFKFLGKSNVKQDHVLHDGAVAKEIRALMKGKKGKDKIFEYEDGKGVSGKVVNRYLAQFDITAKDLRGFHANKGMKDRLNKGKSWEVALKETAEEVGHEEKTLENQYLARSLVDKHKPEKSDKSDKSDKKDDKKSKKKSDFLPPLSKFAAYGPNLSTEDHALLKKLLLEDITEFYDVWRKKLTYDPKAPEPNMSVAWLCDLYEQRGGLPADYKHASRDWRSTMIWRALEDLKKEGRVISSIGAGRHGGDVRLWEPALADKKADFLPSLSKLAWLPNATQRAQLEKTIDDILGDTPVPPPSYERPPEVEPRHPGKMQITSPFGERTDPLTKEKSFHHGVDLAAKNKDGSLASVYSIGDGVVETAGWQDGNVPRDFVPGRPYQKKGGTGFGQHIVVRHPNGFSSVYAHLSEVLVQKGQNISKGQQIGVAGQTGRVTGPHLHMSLRNRDGKPVDPMRYIRQ